MKKSKTIDINKDNLTFLIIHAYIFIMALKKKSYSFLQIYVQFIK